MILELLLDDCPPSALIFGREEMILTIGVLVAQEMFQKSIPVLQVPMAAFDTLSQLDHVRIADGQIQWGEPPAGSSSQSVPRPSNTISRPFN